MKRKTSEKENMKNVPIPETEVEKEEVPFGDPPENYKYKCSRCHFENEMNEANVEPAFGWTKKRTRCSRCLMPVLECPSCSRQTYECVD